VLLTVNVLIATPEADATIDSDVVQESTTEINECEHYNLPKTDELKLLINGYKDEELIKIIFHSMLLEKNYSLYLCEIDKMIDNCFKLNNQRFNANNVIRCIKAALFLGCTAGAGWMGHGIWQAQASYTPDQAKMRNLAVGLCGVATAIFGLHSLTELQKIYNNHDQNQLFYKALAIKNALLNYRK